MDSSRVPIPPEALLRHDAFLRGLARALVGDADARAAATVIVLDVSRRERLGISRCSFLIGRRARSA
jgi:hypothetical protein